VKAAVRGRRLAIAAVAAAVLGTGGLAGCAALDAKQREWIFQPSDRSWWGSAAAEGMQEVWIEHRAPGAKAGEPPAKLHGLFLPGERADAPLLLYLHGARYDVRGSAFRMRRMHELGFAVLGIDYRGFGRSEPPGLLPSESMAVEDALAAWRWLAERHPGTPRYLFGHSLGGAIAVDVASRVDDAAGLIVEGSFTSIADIVASSPWGWVPVRWLITQRFEAGERIARVRAPLLVVHGADDRWIKPELGRALYERATVPKKRFLLVEGGSHHNTNSVGQPAYRQALAELFGIGRGEGAAAGRGAGQN
jgi:alpha-beta hydrolase superfamily lysophospholipase